MLRMDDMDTASIGQIPTELDLTTGLLLWTIAILKHRAVFGALPRTVPILVLVAFALAASRHALFVLAARLLAQMFMDLRLLVALDVLLLASASVKLSLTFGTRCLNTGDSEPGEKHTKKHCHCADNGDYRTFKWALIGIQQASNTAETAPAQQSRP